MPTITFDATGTKAGWNFGPDGGEPPADVARTPAAIHWAVKLASDDTVRLETGAELKTLPGSVYITIGDAGPEGRARYSAGNPIRWGVLRQWDSNNSPQAR